MSIVDLEHAEEKRGIASNVIRSTGIQIQDPILAGEKYQL